MEVNPRDRTSTRDPVQPIRRARFRHAPPTSQLPAEKPTQTTQMLYNRECLEMPPYTYRCTSGTAMPTPASSSYTQSQRSDLSGVRLNCPLDNNGPSGNCSAASLDRSTVITGGPTTIVTEALDDGEGSVYNGRRVGFTEFLKPSTTTAMSLPGAEEATVYNGKIGSLLFSRHQSDATNLAATIAPTTTVNESIFDRNGERLISFGKFTTSDSVAVLGEEGTSAVHKTSSISDKTTCARLRRPKRSWQEDMTEDVTTQLGTSAPEYSIQSGVEGNLTTHGRNEPGTSSQLPAPVRPLDSSCHKRRKTETIRVAAVNSKKSEVPPDGYIWWKCGEKQIKGSPYPRSYYKCKTQDACLAKKNVMRAVDEPWMLNVTYNGEHCHALPPKSNVEILPDAAASSIVPSASADAAGIAWGTVPPAPLEEPTTSKLTHFFEFL